MYWLFMLINFSIKTILHTTKQASHYDNQQVLLCFLYKNTKNLKNYFYSLFNFF